MPQHDLPMRFKARFLGVALVSGLVLAGCSANLPSKLVPSESLTAMPALAPAATATLRPGLSIERWWMLFGDAQLDRLMLEALTRNEDLEAALARVREAQASLDVARAAQSPTLDANASAARSKQSEVGALPLPRGVEREASSYRFSLDAGYEVDLWGRLAAGTDAARHRLFATEWARMSIEWSLTARLAEAYFSLGAVDRQIEISEAMRRSRQATLQLRRREYGAGVGTEFDLRRAEAELTGTDSTLASLARQRAGFERALTQLLGRTPSEIVSLGLERRAMREDALPEALLPEGSAAELLARRPDLRQAEAELAAANASIEAARAATLPTFFLSGSLGSDARRVSDLFSGPAAVWSIAAGVAQPIVDGGRLKARAREEHARAEQALASYRKALAGAVLDVREAYAALDTSQQAYIAERDRAASLARARQLAQLGHDAGALAYLDLLDAERNWYQAQLQQVGAYRDRLIGQVSAYKALGGGYIQSGS
jgi:multidrug efflux system outer membrane protein